jgi:hypothetical protein
MITLLVKRMHCWTTTDAATGSVDANIEITIPTDAKTAGRCLAGHDTGMLRLVLFESAAELEIVDELTVKMLEDGP